MAELTQAVVREDARLEKANEHSREELARHRWHWTLDMSNPKRVSIRAYARSVARHHRTIEDIVNGYEEWRGGGAPAGKLSESIELAKLRGLTGAATEAVAKAHGIEVGTARRHHASEVRTVKAMAEERAERQGTTPAEEVTHAAKVLADSRHTKKAQTTSKKQRRTLRYIEVEGDVAKAVRSLTHALQTAIGVDFDAEEIELIQDSIKNLRALLRLLDNAVTGESGTDWDAELAKLGRAG